MEKESIQQRISGDYVWQCKQVGKRISEKLYTFENEGKLGIIDEHFNYVIPPDYENIIPAFKRHLWVSKNGKWDLINLKQEIIGHSYLDISEYKGQYACVSFDGESYGFINRKAEVVISTKHLKGTYIGGHLFAVPKYRKSLKSRINNLNLKQKSLKYGVIDLNEKIVHPYELNEVPGLQDIYNYIHNKKRSLYEWFFGSKSF